MRNASKKVRKLAEFLVDEERNEEYELQEGPFIKAPHYSPFSQNIMQQQAQLMQMIQMNTANQARFNLQMTHQNKLLQQDMKKKKRRGQK